eukprot:4119451-Prymnesium_polylepis.1
MKVALALSPENALSKRRRVYLRGRGARGQIGSSLACRKLRTPEKGSAKRRYTPNSAYLEPIGGFASCTFLV